MDNITTYTYIYYKKRSLFWLSVGCLCFLLIASWLMYEKYTSFTEPKLLIIICGFPFFGTGLYIFAQGLLHTGPVYIISPQGITDCSRGFIPWHNVKEISVQNGTSSTDKCISIKLKNSEQHFGGILRSFYGKRGINLSSSIMYYREFEGPISLIESNTR